MTVLRLPGRRLRAVPAPPEVPARPWLPEGQGAAEFTFREAIDNFRAARSAGSVTVRVEQEKAGLINVAHAWLWAVTDAGQLSQEQARALFVELVEVSRAFEVGDA